MTSKYQAFKERWQDCDRCPLSEVRNQVVLARGQIPADVLFIGEAPGHSEDTLGKPFVGPAGKLLDRLIETAIPGKVRMAFTNVVSCIPNVKTSSTRMAHYKEDGRNVSEPDEEAIKACAPRLEEFMGLCRPKLVVCVGLMAERCVPPGDEKRIRVIHPAAILRMDVSQRGLAAQRTTDQIAEAVSELNL